MPKFPLLDARKVFKILKNLGFEKIRQEGSHVFFRHPDGRTTVIPNHPGEKLDKGLLIKIVKKDIGISKDEFVKYL